MPVNYCSHLSDSSGNQSFSSLAGFSLYIGRRDRFLHSAGCGKADRMSGADLIVPVLMEMGKRSPITRRIDGAACRAKKRQLGNSDRGLGFPRHARSWISSGDGPTRRIAPGRPPADIHDDLAVSRPAYGGCWGRQNSHGQHHAEGHLLLIDRYSRESKHAAPHGRLPLGGNLSGNKASGRIQNGRRLIRAAACSIDCTCTGVQPLERK